MKWESKKAQDQYNVELQAMKNLISVLLSLHKDLDAVNAGRNRYQKG